MEFYFLIFKDQRLDLLRFFLKFKFLVLIVAIYIFIVAKGFCRKIIIWLYFVQKMCSEWNSQWSLHKIFDILLWCFYNICSCIQYRFRIEIALQYLLNVSFPKYNWYLRSWTKVDLKENVEDMQKYSLLPIWIHF